MFSPHFYKCRNYGKIYFRSTGTATKLKINLINQVYKQTERFIELDMFAKKVYQTFCVLLAFENLVYY